MEIVIDSNIIFSALIKNSKTRKLILEYENYFLFPEYIFFELQNHKNELLKKSQMNKIDFNKLLEILLERVKIIPKSKLLNYKDKAYKIIKDIDINDIEFIACALAYPNSIIWSDDKALKKQSKIKIFNTEEIIGILNK